jgi:predicted deacylase
MAALGERVRQDQVIGKISDPFGHGELESRARYAGIVIGRTQLPLVNEGDAIFHIARFDSSDRAEQTVERFHEQIDNVNTEVPPIV